jgi:WXG100 family type VII secretion target
MASENALTPEQLKAQAKIYQQAAAQIQEVVRRIDSMNQQISQQEQGEGFHTYLKQYQQAEKNIKQMEQLLENFYKQLLEYADTVAASTQKEEASGLG